MTMIKNDTIFNNMNGQIFAFCTQDGKIRIKKNYYNKVAKNFITNFTIA